MKSFINSLIIYTFSIQFTNNFTFFNFIPYIFSLYIRRVKLAIQFFPRVVLGRYLYRLSQRVCTSMRLDRLRCISCFFCGFSVWSVLLSAGEYAYVCSSCGVNFCLLIEGFFSVVWIWPANSSTVITILLANGQEVRTTSLFVLN